MKEAIPRRRGRPPLDPADPAVKVTISLPTKQYDQYCADARQQDLSLPEIIRRAIYGRTYQEINPKK